MGFDHYNTGAVQLQLGVDHCCPKYEGKDRESEKKRKGGVCGGRKECDLFAGILHQWLRWRRWSIVKSQEVKAVRHEDEKCLSWMCG